MHLETCVDCFDQWGVVFDQEFVDTYQIEFITIAHKLLIDGFHQGKVALLWRKIVHVEVKPPQCRKDPCEHDRSPKFIDDMFYLLQLSGAFVFQVPEGIGAEFTRFEVDFEVKLGEFCFHPWPFLHVLEGLHINAGRLKGLLVD